METSKKSGAWKVLLVIVIILAGAYFVAGKAKNDSAVASGHPEWAPIMFQNGDIIDGAGPALVKKIFADLELEVSVPYAGSWEEVQAKAKSGEVDILVAAYKTSEREAYMNYSDAYTVDPVAVFVKKGKEFTFDKNEDLVGKKGVGTEGDSYGQAFDDFSKEKLNLVRTKTSKEAFDLVASGQADYFIYSFYAGNKEIAEDEIKDMVSLPKYVIEESFYITISKKSSYAKYLPEINKQIQKYKADGTINALIEQYKTW